MNLLAHSGLYWYGERYIKSNFGINQFVALGPCLHAHLPDRSWLHRLQIRRTKATAKLANLLLLPQDPKPVQSREDFVRLGALALETAGCMGTLRYQSETALP